MSFLQSLDQHPIFHRLMQWFRIRKIAGLLLYRFPLVRKLPNSSLRYRCRYIETFVAADEILHRNLYDKAVASKKVSTFVDLGCNVGLFAVKLAHMTDRRDLQGLMIDANKKMIDETSWILSANRLDRVIPLHGLVGTIDPCQTVDFFLSESNLGSSQFPMDQPCKAKKSQWTKTTVPRIDLETEWTKHFNNLRCNVLKVDIEGSEANLFSNNDLFFKRVDVVVLEWHKWVVEEDVIHVLLQDRGFDMVEVLDETDSIGVAWYKAKLSTGKR